MSTIKDKTASIRDNHDMGHVGEFKSNSDIFEKVNEVYWRVAGFVKQRSR